MEQVTLVLVPGLSHKEARQTLLLHSGGALTLVGRVMPTVSESSWAGPTVDLSAECSHISDVVSPAGEPSSYCRIMSN